MEKLTKEEMVNEMLDNLNSKHFRNTYYETMMKKTKKQINFVYNAWIKENKQHTLFYVSLLDY